MTPEQLQALRALADAATPGPWVAAQVPLGNESYYVAIVDGRAVLDTYVSLSDADAAFIAAAREAVPALLAEVERLTAALHECQERDTQRRREVERLTAELDSYKRNAAYINSVIESEGVYRP